MIVVASDVHLLESRPPNWPEDWYVYSIDNVCLSKFSKDNSKSLTDDCVFSKFLCYLAENQFREGGDLVLLGDFIDLWRSDFVQVSQDPIIREIIANLTKLVNKNVQIHCIAGNHDYNMLKFDNASPTNNPFGNVVKSLRRSSGVFFTHGYQLEVLTWEIYKAIDLYEWFADKFCLTDAKIGADVSKFWDEIHPQMKLSVSNSTEALGWPKYSMPELRIELAKQLGSRLKGMGKAPEERFEDIDVQYKIEMVAASAARCLYPGMRQMEIGDLLVFGHTHIPYYDPVHKVLNAGSWKKKPCNVYRFVEIDEENGGKIVFKNFDESRRSAVTVDYEKPLSKEGGK
jgi:UDP-2,3-diacylglucosamine pyrophosphatase LpxH